MASTMWERLYLAQIFGEVHFPRVSPPSRRSRKLEESRDRFYHLSL